jgi:hypothetical protein
MDEKFGTNTLLNGVVKMIVLLFDPAGQVNNWGVTEIGLLHGTECVTGARPNGAKRHGWFLRYLAVGLCSINRILFMPENNQLDADT